MTAQASNTEAYRLPTKLDSLLHQSREAIAREFFPITSARATTAALLECTDLNKVASEIGASTAALQTNKSHSVGSSYHIVSKTPVLLLNGSQPILLDLRAGQEIQNRLCALLEPLGLKVFSGHDLRYIRNSNDRPLYRMAEVNTDSQRTGLNYFGSQKWGYFVFAVGTYQDAAFDFRSGFKLAAQLANSIKPAIAELKKIVSDIKNEGQQCHEAIAAANEAFAASKNELGNKLNSISAKLGLSPFVIQNINDTIYCGLKVTFDTKHRHQPLPQTTLLRIDKDLKEIFSEKGIEARTGFVYFAGGMLLNVSLGFTQANLDKLSKLGDSDLSTLKDKISAINYAFN